MSVTLAIAVLIAFSATLLLTPKWIRFLDALGLTGIDIQKRSRLPIAEMGGPTVLGGFLLGIFAFIGGRVFFYGQVDGLVELFAGITTILIVSLIGIFDDLGGLSHLRIRDHFGNVKRIGLPQWAKPLLTLPAALPLMAIMAGDSAVTIPLIGPVQLGLLYPLVFIPLGVIGASNAVNMLAGLNGLEAGLGTVLLTALGLFSLAVGNLTGAAIAIIFAVSLLAFLRWNWYPAKVLPGDSLLYAIGATVAVVAVLGNIEKFALYAFMLWFIEGLLKARSFFRAQSFGLLQPDGTLAAPRGKVYSLTHLVMRLGRFTEQQVAAILIGAQLVIGIFLLAYFLLWSCPTALACPI